jgi:mRNA-degrading endonuclease toxin of MazEF toxin-antitoxin module
LYFSAGGKTTGVVLSDQIKSFDWSARAAEFIEHRPDIAPQVAGKIRALLGLQTMRPKCKTRSFRVQQI